ncbi:hypothetical protein SLE2022_095860 [Rubroshorea leprosula]
MRFKSQSATLYIKVKTLALFIIASSFAWVAGDSRNLNDCSHLPSSSLFLRTISEFAQRLNVLLLVFVEEIQDLDLCYLDDLMESKGGKKKSSSSSKSLFYEAPLGYSIEDVRPNGGIRKFRSAAYSNCARKPS